MLVETFEVISDDITGGDNSTERELQSTEARALIESLDLDGQRSLLAESRDTGTIVRNPYRRMTQTEDRIYRAVCPQVEEISRYSDGPIPLRVLQVAAHAKDLFPRLEVWFEPGSRYDPLLVGCDNTSTYSIKERHMLARWGDVLLPMDELAAMAAKKLRAGWEKTLRDAIGTRQRFLDSLDAQVAAYLGGQSEDTPSAYPSV